MNRVLLVSAALVGVLLPGCAKPSTPNELASSLFAKEREKIPLVITDADRAAEADRLYAQFNALIEELAATTDLHRDRVRLLNADRDTPRARFTAEFERYDEDRAQLVARILDARENIAATLTADEWQRLVTDDALKAADEFADRAEDITP